MLFQKGPRFLLEMVIIQQKAGQNGHKAFNTEHTSSNLMQLAINPF